MLLIGLWPSPIKKLIYRLMGYRIGRNVSIGFGSVICGEDVEVGDSVQISFGTAIRGKTIRLGAHVQIGALTFIDTPHIEIGDGSKFNEQVFVGGLQFPDSRFVVGRNCLIMQMCYINPCRSITIGDDSGVGVDCLLIGHSSWQSKFEGYSVGFEPIVIGKSVALAWRVTVLPGTKIGDGATIGANSLVKETIPPRCLAVGFPARVVARAPYFPRTVKDGEKVQFLKEITAEMKVYLGESGLTCREEGAVTEVRQTTRRWFFTTKKSWRFAVRYEADESTSKPESATVDVLVSLARVPEQERTELVHRGRMWIDLAMKERSDLGNPLGEEIAHYLKRYGVRLFRVK
jgi:acetyltransferase-like isoleucine patch superfamily enzyme